ncbi:MAG: YajD family HNH nuclease [Smithellaceae bacterium]|nr:YajD family HNH nuclease [Smithellaceae bacterium]
MAKISFSSRGGRVRTSAVKSTVAGAKSAADVVREIKKGSERPPGEDYRERSLAIHGLICARCGREFDETNRHLLTVHHKDGNHYNNPPDGSNWENLCAYCHEDIHSRGVLGEYFDGAADSSDGVAVYRTGGDNGEGTSLGSLADKLKKALDKNK